MTRKIILHTLRCDKTEDYFGGDECILEVFTDGKQRIQLKQDMKAGGTWSLGKSYDFNQDASVKLWDEDNPSLGDPNDFLGEVKVGVVDANFATAKFTKGADYTLTYSVTVDRPPQPASTPPSHVTIELLDVYCGNTEDVTGADDFYILGGLTVFDSQASAMDPALAKAILTKPVKINDGQTKPLSYTVFDADVKGSAVIYMEMAAYDEDFAKDWSQYQVWAGMAATAVGTIVGIVATPVAGTVVGAVLAGANQAAGWDKDDRLGIHAHTITVKDLKPGETIHEWKMVETGIGWSTWDYRVRYKVTVK